MISPAFELFVKINPRQEDCDSLKVMNVVKREPTDRELQDMIRNAHRKKEELKAQQKMLENTLHMREELEMWQADAVVLLAEQDRISEILWKKISYYEDPDTAPSEQ